MTSQDRGQAIAIGALLLLGLLTALVAFSQIAVFPQINEEREIEAQKSAYQDILNVKSGMQRVSDTNPKSTVIIDTEVSYPIQPINPTQIPSQIVYNRGNLSLDRAQYANNSSDFEKIDFTNSINTISLIPKYTELLGSRRIVLDNSVVFENNPQSGYVRRTDQSIINGREISLYYVDSNVDGLSSSSTIPISINIEETEEYLVTGVGSNDIVMNLTTTRGLSDWKTFLETSQENVESVELIQSGANRNLSISLDGTVNYSVTYKKIEISSVK